MVDFMASLVLRGRKKVLEGTLQAGDGAPNALLSSLGAEDSFLNDLLCNPEATGDLVLREPFKEIEVDHFTLFVCEFVFEGLVEGLEDPLLGFCIVLWIVRPERVCLAETVKIGKKYDAMSGCIVLFLLHISSCSLSGRLGGDELKRELFDGFFRVGGPRVGVSSCDVPLMKLF